jgi:hypothetical protein
LKAVSGKRRRRARARFEPPSDGDVEAPNAVRQFARREADGTCGVPDFVDVVAMDLIGIGRVPQLDGLDASSAPIMPPNPQTANLDLVAFEADVEDAPVDAFGGKAYRRSFQP